MQRAGSQFGHSRTSNSLSWCVLLHLLLRCLLPSCLLPATDVVMVNSSWTAAHVRQLWWMWEEPALVYPPCDTTDLQTLPLDRRLKHLFLVSVAQFRPEKNHRLQLEAYAMAREVAGERARTHVHPHVLYVLLSLHALHFILSVACDSVPPLAAVAWYSVCTADGCSVRLQLPDANRCSWPYH